MTAPTPAQVKFWNDRQAAATTPEQVVAVWFDACRMVAKKASKAGRPEVTRELASHLHDFYMKHAA